MKVEIILWNILSSFCTEMDKAIGVQTLDEAAFISLRASTLGKVMNTTIIPSAMGK